MAFPKQIFMKLTNFQQHCEQISYIEFCPNLTTDAQSMDTNSEVKCDFHCYNFQETYNYTINFVDISYIEFDPQWKKNVANMGNKSSFNV